MRSVLAIHLYGSVLIVPLKCHFPIRPTSTPSSATDVFCIRKIWEHFPSRRGNILTRCIVDKNGPCNSLDVEVVVVVAGDGEVTHPAYVVDGNRAAVATVPLAVLRCSPLDSLFAGTQ
jgi:hypothetical protein